ncbi:hypothetical protein [Ralstonia solanacearum]|nr:hypothetical protein [Ralstonia solanacearum]AMP69798.1 hypothetical protein UW163_10075 [Ralstonia solanacearum]AMP73292.1 hypothetical protein RALBFv3_03585 [Ralstonia solanacearum]AYB60181.1 hypothetical protein C2124_06010 [Ralstonia solanacearum]MBB6586990.1 hypothetical protein [Ralstonia solanacearum]MCG3576170.1 hypothetical protein [Ralstonia solanacearum]
MASPIGDRACARLVMLGASALLLAACGSHTVALKPQDNPNKPQQPLAFVPPLDTLIGQTGNGEPVSRIKVIFIHGVGDHCPGYALDGVPSRNGDDADPSAWLSAHNRAEIGLTPTQPGASTDVRWYASPVHGIRPLPGKPAQSALWFAVAKRSYDFRGRDGRQLRVDASEITWSGLTQAFKTQYLGYDTASSLARDTQCSTDLSVGAGSPPDSRELVNHGVKETLFDTALADAVLYMGSYREALQLAVAYGLCRAIADTGEDCGGTPDAHTRYLFVTHSLGSRILYDVLLGLHGVGPQATMLQHSGIARPSSKTVMEVMNATPAIYMMANQLVLLGLSNLPPDAEPDQPPMPFDARRTLNLPVQPGMLPPSTAPSPAPRREDFGLRAFAQSPLVQGRTDTLNIVAFSDINDVLSWGIPSQYLKDETNPDGTSHLRITNVYVRNTPWLPWLLESPVPAHTGYFNNPDVWRVISRGICGDDQPLSQCQGNAP